MNVAVAMTTAAVLAACGGGADNVDLLVRDITPKDKETVNITANCAAPDLIEVDVDKWVIDMKKNGEVTFVVSPTSSDDAVVTIEQKSPALWPFEEDPPFATGKGAREKKAKTKKTKAKYQYNLRVVCGVAPNARTVLIDPDIFVD